MTFKEMQDEVDLIIKDDSLVFKIPSIINDTVQLALNECKIPSLKIPMVANTVVGQSWTNLPSGFFGSLLFAGTVDGEITVAGGGVRELMEDEPLLSEEGDVEKIAHEGNVLWYRKRPTTVTAIAILGYKSPDPLVQPNDIPTYIPEYLHRWILVYGAAAALWSVKEEGIEGEKPNTVDYGNKFSQGMVMLGTWVGTQTKHLSRSIWSH